ncbi:hypothetical protein IWZ00DRAFT_517217 [Phyllosticta capitalensis]
MVVEWRLFLALCSMVADMRAMSEINMVEYLRARQSAVWGQLLRAAMLVCWIIGSASKSESRVFIQQERGAAELLSPFSTP